MEKNIFLDLAGILSKEEQNRFLDFLRSPYFNQSGKIHLQVSLMHLAWQWLDENPGRYWDESEVFVKIFDDSEPFLQTKMNRLKTPLVSLLRDFFAEDARRQGLHPVEKLRWEMKFYRNKGELHYHELREKEARQELLRRQRFLSLEDLLQEYLLEDELAWLPPGENRREEDYLGSALLSLDRLWLVLRTRWSAMILNQSQRITLEQSKEHQWFLERVLNRFPKYQPAQHALVQLFKRVSKLFEPNPDPEIVLREYLDFVRRFCNKTEKELDEDLKNGKGYGTRPNLVLRDELEAFASNFCVRQINQGNTEFYVHHFDLLKARLDSKGIYRDGKILASSFLAIVTTALKLPREKVSLDWVKNFLDSHKGRLYNRKAAEEMIRYNYANYYFHIGNYKRALKNANETYSDLNFKIVSKVLEIKSLYEIGDEKQIESRILANYAFFRRESKIPAQKRKPLLRFANCTEKLFIEWNMPNADRLRALAKDINSQPTSESAWLLEKVNDLLSTIKPPPVV